jgi:hypothetical protein
MNRVHQLGIADINKFLGDREKNVLRAQALADGYAIGIDALVDLKNDDFSTVKELFLRIFELIEPGSRVYGVKSTAQYNIMDAFLKGGFKVLFCVRDPRDMLVSAKNRFSEFNIFEFAIELENTFAALDCAQKSLNCLMVRYEDFILDKEKEIERIASFLGMEISLEVSLVHRNNLKFVSNSSFEDVNSMFNPSGVNRWRKSENDLDIKFIASAFRETMEKMGYEVETHPEVSSMLKQYRRYKFKKSLRKRISRFIN